MLARLTKAVAVAALVLAAASCARVDPNRITVTQEGWTADAVLAPDGSPESVFIRLPEGSEIPQFSDWRIETGVAPSGRHYINVYRDRRED